MAVLLPLVIVLPVAAHRTIAAPANYRVATIGGLQYQAVEGRPIHPSNRVDAAILKGLPRKEQHVGKHHILYGAFLSVTNHSARPLADASRIELRDDALHVYRPLRLPAANAYAYRPGTVAPGAQVPASGTRADDNLASEGSLLLFRVPTWRYRNGSFELQVHDPAGGVRSIPL